MNSKNKVKKFIPKLVGDSINAENASWTFKGTADNFDSHIRRSVPFYDEGHELICESSDYFVKEGSVCYELGSSTGELISKLANRNQNKNATWIGIDSEPEMTEKAKADHQDISFICDNITTTDFQNSDLIVSYYTIQFIPPKHRQDLITKIYESLNWGGAFLFFEKVRGADARFQDILTGLYTDFKLKNNFSPDEIIAKSRSLKGVLEPFSTQGNLDLLTRAGFKDTMTIFKIGCFEGVLAIK